MNRAQGNTRQSPDGFLHIQNFTVTAASGVAGLAWQLLDDHQKGLVEGCLIERACALEESSAHHFKHNVWRFRKTFLKSNFESAVRLTLNACNIDPMKLFESQWDLNKRYGF